ncbi:RdgB/HAM1 family non-canonical purine NTP pyrophosphatase [Helicobacter sp. 13S00477-4]|uniref:RdgB/HAM1 family non-canonical purine NTP pyrophosphatase n=1 Tax=Helicobacter sp. 13S00477-4 TaxID=1905759 RepID=UPI000BA75941|nr:RdgB/HAM1 family non-canonical purine NTP pyrophosphatase [Helicobacter sp. 13S00477-4]PAF52564.1 non-canonical purine NTP pyrophosphatase, RdgB/HAM1 family [Helicobacter sp. 13S00477-4]
MNPKILVGSSNEGKIKEIKQILDQFEIISNAEIFNTLEIVENGDTFEKNALLKANIFYEALNIVDENLIAIADDSGLCVDILDGEPGIYSARYANLSSGILENASDGENIKHLIENLHKKGVNSSNARFVCMIGMIGKIEGKKVKKIFKGELIGKIIDTPCGKNGFGYDPLFIPEGYEKSLSQMEDNEKNKISHRKNALEKFKYFLINYLSI